MSIPTAKDYAAKQNPPLAITSEWERGWNAARAEQILQGVVKMATDTIDAMAQQPEQGNMLEGAVGGVKFYGRRIFAMDPASPWVVQSLDARGEGPTHEAAVAAWYAAHEAKYPAFAVGHLQYRPRQEPMHMSWAWHVYADGGDWLLCDGSSYDAQFYPVLAQRLGTIKGGIIQLADMTTATPVAEGDVPDVPCSNPTRDSLQP